MEKKRKTMHPIGRMTGGRVRRARMRKRAEELKPGEKIVRAELGVVEVLKVMEAGNGYVALRVVRADGGQTLLKIHPWETVLLQTERIL